MADKTLKAVKTYFTQSAPPRIDAFSDVEHAKGRRAKRTIDMGRTNQNYYRMKTIQQELLDHYENVDWYERDTQFDFLSYADRIQS